jgi:hypothetical protein
MSLLLGPTSWGTGDSSLQPPPTKEAATRDLSLSHLTVAPTPRRRYHLYLLTKARLGLQPVTASPWTGETAACLGWCSPTSLLARSPPLRPSTAAIGSELHRKEHRRRHVSWALFPLSALISLSIHLVRFSICFPYYDHQIDLHRAALSMIYVCSSSSALNHASHTDLVYRIRHCMNACLLLPI